MGKIRVLIVDDSALIRKVLKEILSSDPEIEVVGTANDPLIARDKIKLLSPDVITLDVEMPKMDGITFLKNIMRLRPMPVVMISTLTDAGAAVTLQALELGAVDYVAKPKMDVNVAIEAYSEEIISKVKMASQVSRDVLARKYEIASNQAKTNQQATAHAISELHSDKALFNTTDKIIAIGSSTGGTEAVKEVLLGLPPNVAGIVVAQHIPITFSGPFAQRLNDTTSLTVTQAKNGDLIMPGRVYIAPGDKHLVVKKSGAKYYCKLEDGPEVNRHKPSVEVLFNSVAACAGPNAMGIMLTGMGADGAKGMLEMKQQGAITVVQDEKTSVVWGMPGAAVKLGAVDEIVPLNKVAEKIMDYCRKQK
ncbi:MAG: chemotaxis response regulator protein-glutamate methylesterase [Gammaproteobacteria bacterium]|nr:chemotaxis response regulator protein-glutamate methylesterase [Gammaproteobacteria bacterium]